MIWVSSMDCISTSIFIAYPDTASTTGSWNPPIFLRTRNQREKALAAATFHWQASPGAKGIPNRRLELLTLINEPPKMRSYEGYLEERYVEIVKALVAAIRRLIRTGSLLLTVHKHRPRQRVNSMRHWPKVAANCWMIACGRNSGLQRTATDRPRLHHPIKATTIFSTTTPRRCGRHLVLWVRAGRIARKILYNLAATRCSERPAESDSNEDLQHPSGTRPLHFPLGVEPRPQPPLRLGRDHHQVLNGPGGRDRRGSRGVFSAKMARLLPTRRLGIWGVVNSHGRVDDSPAWNRQWPGGGRAAAIKVGGRRSRRNPAARGPPPRAR